MANWTNVAEGNFEGESIKATDIKEGDSLEGKVTAIEESKTHEGAYFLFLDNNGDVTRIFTAGKLSYAIKDQKIVVGNTYRITRLADLPAKKKGSKGMTNFQVQVDRDSAKKAMPAI